MSLYNPTVEALHADLDSQGSTKPELKRPPKDSVVEQPKISFEIPETPAVALKNIRRGHDDYSDDNNTPSYLY
jgi:hypothetical protein